MRFKIFYLLVFSVLLFTACSSDPIGEVPSYNPTAYNLNYPDNVPEMILDESNPLTKEGVELGRMLYYDTLLHPTSEMACADCHQQKYAFSSTAAVLPHINLGWNQAFLWNGKISGNVEDIMRFEVEEFFGTDVSRFNKDDNYPQLFQAAFGVESISTTEISYALAQFVRTLISFDSKYDKVISGTSAVFTDSELNGHDIFFTEKGDCFHCHGGILFTDNLFHNNGLDINPSENGLSEISGNPIDLGKFKTPTLRNIEFSGPYMHDGRYETLEEVIEFYSEGLHLSSTIDPLMKQAYQGGIRLTEQEKIDLIAFLKTLSDDSFLQKAEHSSPF